MKEKTFYITTPIYYPSNKLHIGHAYTTTTCDSIARYKRMRGYDVHFLTGSDEHGEKIARIAENEGITPLEYTNKIVDGFKNLWQLLNISNDDFIRTTDFRHEETVQRIFTKLLEQGDIYKGQYEGKYCVPCEAYWTDSQLTEDGLCPDCQRPVETKIEESYFFKMSKYADRLVEYYESHPEFIEPISRKNEMMANFIKPGLEDLSISRTSFDWGIEVKEDKGHVVYVWIDALANYLSALGYLNETPDLMPKYFGEDTEILQVVGKEIVRFHTIYWPILLMALGLRLPDKIYAHGWILMQDGKMSKSKGNVVDPIALIDRYGSDALRHYLLSQISLGNDGIFTPELFIGCLNTDLANNLGNLLNRTVAMAHKYFGGTITKSETNTEFDDALVLKSKDIIEEYYNNMDAYKVDKASKNIFELVSYLNKYIDDTQPWVLAKEEEKQAELMSVLYHLLSGLRIVGILLRPFLINISQEIFSQLNIELEDNFDNIDNFNYYDKFETIKGAPIFNRLDLDEELVLFQGEVNE